MHFAKPNSAYFTEILAQLGWPTDQPVCMVGNYFQHDILPLQDLDIPGYLIDNGNDSKTISKTDGVTTGSLENLIPWLDSVAFQNTTPRYDQPAAILSILRSTPGAVASLTRSLTQPNWESLDPQTKVNSFDIITQFNNYEQNNLPAFSTFCQPNLGLDIEAQISHDCREEIQKTAVFPNPTMIDFYTSRSIFISQLDLLPRERWSEVIDHPIFGRKTIFECLNQFAANDQRLLHQLRTNIDLL
jgi:hypothetical protein